MIVDRYDLVLLQLRQMAAEAGDYRSLVAIAAEFERNGPERLRALVDAVERAAHSRNVTGKETNKFMRGAA